jgi:methylated-DNA-[protein]-cysteine S-methyltransferase
MLRNTTKSSLGVASNRPPQLAAAVFSTDLGWMAVAHRDGVLHGLVFGHATPRSAVAALSRSTDTGEQDFEVDVVTDEAEPLPVVQDLLDRLRRFASGETVDFRSIEIDNAHLTRFGRRVVAACRRIPAGQTRSYGQLATVSGSPGAARAVGQVMARNRFPLVVPCHRVLASGGGLGGFSAPQGLAMKRRLLTMERASSRDLQTS